MAYWGNYYCCWLIFWGQEWFLLSYFLLHSLLVMGPCQFCRSIFAYNDESMSSNYHYNIDISYNFAIRIASNSGNKCEFLWNSPVQTGLKQPSFLLRQVGLMELLTFVAQITGNSNSKLLNIWIPIIKMRATNQLKLSLIHRWSMLACDIIYLSPLTARGLVQPCPWWVLSTEEDKIS